MPHKHHVVVDGSNLATEGRTLPSLRQLDEAVRAYADEDPDAEIVVVVDASFSHRIDPSEQAQFEEAELAGEVVSPPAGAIGRGDAFVLRIAERTGATVLSNDSFQEFHAEHPWLFDEGRLVGGKPVPGVGWIFTPRVPVRGKKSHATEAKTKRAGAATAPLPAPLKAAELAKAVKKAAKRAAKTTLPAVAPPAGAPRGTAAAPRKAAKRAKATTAATAAEPTAAPPAPASSTRGGRTRTPSTSAARPAAGAAAAKAATKNAAAAKKPASATMAAPKDKAAPKKPEASSKQAPASKAGAKRAGSKAAATSKRAAPAAADPGADGRRRPGRALRKAIAEATAEVLAPPAPGDAKAGKPKQGKSPKDGKGAKSAKSAKTDKQGAHRRASSKPLPAVNEPLAFINFVAAHPVGSEVHGEVVSFTSHGAMVAVVLPEGELVDCYIPLTGLADPPPTKAREVLAKGEVRPFVLVGLDPARRVAELALPGVLPRTLTRATAGS